MTRKKESEQKVPVKKDVAGDVEPLAQDDAEVASEEQKEINALKELTEMKQKQIEGKEPEKLEYYSKEHLIENVAKLEVEMKATQEKIQKLKKEAEEWRNKYMRLQAEFENAQKRWDKNRQNLRLEYTASVLKSFLPLYDSFTKALSDDKETIKVLKGFYDQFISILKSHKAEPMNVKINELFNYSTQEALTSIEKSDIPNNTIVEVVQDGWKIDKEVLRYAKVIISREPKPPESEPELQEVEIEQTSEPETKEKLSVENAHSQNNKESNEEKDNGIKTNK